MQHNGGVFTRHCSVNDFVSAIDNTPIPACPPPPHTRTHTHTYIHTTCTHTHTHTHTYTHTGEGTRGGGLYDSEEEEDTVSAEKQLLSGNLVTKHTLTH